VATLMMRRFWPALLVLAAVALSFGPALAHPGHEARAGRLVASQVTPIVTPAKAPHHVLSHATMSTPAHGQPCCPADTAAGKCCPSVGCTVAAAALPVAGVPITFMARLGGAMEPSPVAIVAGISGTPPLPPPRFLADAVIG